VICKMKKFIQVVAVWYFVAFSIGSVQGSLRSDAPSTQIGPFAGEAACETYNTAVAADYLTLPCFSYAGMARVLS
jgi:hypothetical protein